MKTDTEQTVECRQCGTWGDGTMTPYRSDMCGYCSNEGNVALVWADAHQAISTEEEKQEAPPELERIDPKRIRQILGRAGYKGETIRKGHSFGGYKVLGTAGMTEERITVFWRQPDHVADEQAEEDRPRWLQEYADALEAKGYTCRIAGRGLTVTKEKVQEKTVEKKETKTMKAQEEWEVSAQGEAGSEFVYRVSTPEGAMEMDVLCEAYGTHGQRYLDGEVSEYLAPGGTARKL